MTVRENRPTTTARRACPTIPSPLTTSPSPLRMKIYINGKLYDKEDAKISVYDHGLLYGDGVFEGMRSYGGKVFRLEQHLERLWNSAKAIWLEIPMTREAMAKAVNDTLAANELRDAYIRLVVTRGAGTLGLDPNRTSDPAGDHHHRSHQLSIPKSSIATAWRSSRPAPRATIRRHSARGSSRSII